MSDTRITLTLDDESSEKLKRLADAQGRDPWDFVGVVWQGVGVAWQG